MRTSGSSASSLVRELQSFLRAAFLEPVPRDHRESPAALRRRRVVAVVTIVIGALLLGLSLNLAPGDNLFYVTTLALAVTWVIGAVLSGPLHLGRARTRSGELVARPVVQPLVVGVAAVVVFTVGAVGVAHVGPLRDSVNAVLDHARFASLPVVVLVTFVNGVAEELFFRGALFAAIGKRHPVTISTVLYTATTLATGSLMLVLAAAVLGLLVGLERRVTGGILAPMITHVIWSTGMLLILPPLLAWLS